MELLLAAVAGFLLFMAVGLPLVGVGRVMRLTRRVDDLARRIDEVDRRLREAPGAVPAAPPDRTTNEAVAAEPAPEPDGPYERRETAATVATRPVERALASMGTVPDAPSPAVAPPPLPADTGPAPPARRPTLEERIGARWLLYAAIAALVVGTSYFVKYAFDNEWVTPLMRVVLGGAAGLALCEAGRRFAAREYAFYGQGLAGGGVVLLYVSAFAAFRDYALVSPSVAFGLCVGITAMAAALADSQRAQPLAMLALVGGFATPFLVGGSRDAHVALFSYDATLVAGTLVLARRHAWPLLNVVAFGLTALTVIAWLAAGYTRARWPSTELFLTLFCAMFLYAWRHVRQNDSVAGRGAALLLATAPLLYHVASIAILSTHSLPLLVYLIAMTGAGVIAAEVLDLRWLRVVVLAVVVLPLLAWATTHGGPSWLLPGAITVVAVYGLHLIASLRAAHDEARPRDLEIVLLHGNGLALYFLLDALMADRGIVSAGWLAAALGVWHLGLAGLVRRWSEEAACHFLALAFALLAVAVAFEASGPWVAAGWAAEGAAVSWIGLRVGRGWIRVGGLALFAMALMRLTEALNLPAPMGQTVLFNTRAGVALFVIALAYLTARVHVRARRDDVRRWAFEVGALVVLANLMTVLWVTAEIDAWFRPLEAERGAAATAAHLARQVTTSMAWAAYGVVLVAAGIRRRYTPVRYLAMALLVVTIAKVFFVDLARLDVASRILSTIGLGLLLLVASHLYQRFQTGTRASGASPPVQPPPSQEHHS